MELLIVFVIGMLCGMAIVFFLLRRRAAFGNDSVLRLVQPLQDSLERVDGKIRELEQARAGAYSGLYEQVKSLAETQSRLRAETEKLNSAFHVPQVRGRWGEVQLRRVVELAGMLAYCDFFEQVSSFGNVDENGVRPDMVVRLPGNRSIVIDAKVPLTHYLEANAAIDDHKRELMLKEHAHQVRRHIASLAKKTYWRHFEPSPEFVVLFLPGEMYFSAALSKDPELIEFGAGLGVVLATPTTLIALLKAIYYGWRQEALAKNTEQISQLARELVRRIGKMAEAFNKLGRNLERAVESYNQTLGSMESRVLATARKLEACGGEEPETEMVTLQSLDIVPRHFRAPELQEPGP